MSTSDEMQHVLRALLPPPLSSDASNRPVAAAHSTQCLLYFTSDWAAPADARVLPDAAAARAPMVVLRQRLLDDADSSDAVLSAAEKTVPPAYVLPYDPLHLFMSAASVCGISELTIAVLRSASSTFRNLCKHFRITALPASVVVDVSNASIEVVGGTKSFSLLLTMTPTHIDCGTHDAAVFPHLLT